MEEPPDNVDEKDESYEFVVSVKKSWVSEESLSSSFSTSISAYWRDNSTLNDVITKVDSGDEAAGGGNNQSEAVTNSSSYQCKSCSVYYDDFFAYLRHTKDCPKSSTSFESNSVKKIKRYPCNTCEKQFTTKSNMYRHMKTHMGSRSQNHKCYICNKQFSSSTVLLKHIKVHGNVKPYKCNICSGVFSHTSNLKKHMKRKHADPIDKFNNTNNMHVMKTFESISMADFESINGNANNINFMAPNTNHHTFMNTVNEHPVNTINSVNPINFINSINPENFINSVNPINIINSVNPENINSANPENINSVNPEGIINSVNPEGIINSVNPVNIINSVNPVNITNSVNPANTDGKKKKKVCNICNKQFSTSGNLSRHKKIHYGDKPYHCTECNKQFMEKNDLKRHMKTHELKKSSKPKSTAKLKNVQESELDECLSPVDSNMDSNIDSNEGKKMHICNICDKQFLYKSNYLTHMRIHSSEKPFKCTQCSSRFTQSSNLYRHMKLHKSGKTIKVKTPKNKNVFRVSQVMNFGEDKFQTESDNQTESDKETTIETRDGTRLCNVCGKQFSTEGNLTRHMKIHLGEKPYVCNYCPRQFTQSNDLKRHLKVHLRERSNDYNDPDEVEEETICDIQESPLDQFSIGDKMSHKCDICFKELSTDGNLKRHMKIHTGERPFKCEICDRRFTLRDDLKRHMKIHLSGNKEVHSNNAEKHENAQVQDTEIEALMDTQEQKLQFSDSNDVETCIKTEPDGELRNMKLEEAHVIQDNDLQVFMSTQAPEMQFKETNDLEMMSNSQIRQCNNIEMCHDTKAKQMVYIKSELDTNVNTQLEEPKVHIIHNNDYEAVTDAEYMKSNSLEMLSKTPHVLETQISQGSKSLDMEVREVNFMHNNNNGPGIYFNTQLDTPEVHIIENNDFEGLTDMEEPDMYFMHDNDLGILPGMQVKERHYNRSETLLRTQVNEPVAISSEPHPIDDHVIQPIFVYKNKEYIHHDEDIIVVNSSQVCNICSEHFPTEEELFEHMNLHNGGEPHMFQGNNGESNNMKKHMCNICMKRFSTDGNLNRHMKIHTGEKPFHCESCGRQFTQSNDLKRHLKIHLREEANGYKYIDGDINQSPTSMHQYDSPCSSEEGKIFVCSTCGKRYSSLGNLKRHLKLHVGLKMSQYQVIDKHSYQNNDLEVVTDTQMETNAIDYETSARPALHTLHSGDANTKLGSESNGKYFMCNVCHKSYTSLGNLKRHLKLNHSGVKDSQSNEFDDPYQRNDVGQGTKPAVEGFMGHTSLEKPLGTPQSITGGNTEIKSSDGTGSIKQRSSKRYMCSVCCKHYSTLKSLKRHLKLHVGLKLSEYKVIDRQSSPGKEVKKSVGTSFNDCEESGRPPDLQAIDGNAKLNPHNLDISNNVKSYLCNVCGKQYSSLGNLKRHLKLNHSGVKDSQSTQIDSSYENNAFDTLDTDPSVNASYIIYEGPEKPLQESLESTDINTELKLHAGLNMSQDQVIDKHIYQNNDLSSDKVVTNQLMETNNIKYETPRPVTAQSADIKPGLSSKNLTSINNGKYINLCNICGKCYSNIGNLKRHIKLNHGIGKDSQFKEVDSLSENNDLDKGISPTDGNSMGYVNSEKSVVETLQSTDVDTTVEQSISDSTKINKSFVCTICSKRFSSCKSLERHSELHAGLKGSHFKVVDTQSCQDNDLKVDVNRSPGTSSIEHEKSGKPTLLCNVCGKSYFCLDNLKRHLKMNHSGVNTSQSVEIRGNLETEKSLLRTLQSSDINTEVKHSKANGKCFICNVCSKPYSSVQRLKRHLKLHPGFKVCQYSMSNMYSDFEVTGKPPQRTSFTELETLQSINANSEVDSDHLNVSGYERTICNICGRQYSSVGNLKRHIKLNHSNLDDSQYETICNICGKQYSSGGNLKRHIKLNHSSMEDSQCETTCDLCGRQYSSVDNLKRHIKLNHSSVKDSQHEEVDNIHQSNDLDECIKPEPDSFMECEDFESEQEETLPSIDVSTDLDVSGSTGSRAFYECSVCGKCYSTPGNLKRHMKLHLGLNISQYKVVDRQTYPNGGLKIASFIEYEQSGKSVVETPQSLDAATTSIMDNTNSEKSFACNICGKSYLCLGNLKRHLDSNHLGEEDSQSNEIDSPYENNDSDIVDNELNFIYPEELESGASDQYNNIKNEDSDNTTESHNVDNNDLDNIRECDNVNNNDSDNTTEYNNVDNNDLDNTRECNNISNNDSDNTREYNNVNDDSGNTEEYNNVNINDSDINVINNNCDNIKEENIHNNNNSNIKEGNFHICTICGNKYTNIGSLQRHMKKHTMDHKESKLKHSNAVRNKYKSSAYNSNRTIKHTCPICSKQFSTGSNLSRHMKIHTGEKPYKCKHCYRYFTQSNDLKRHTKTHFL